MAQRHHAGRVHALGLVLRGGRVAPPDLLLLVEPLLVALPRTGVTDPLHEALLARRLVGLVGLAVRAADLHVCAAYLAIAASRIWERRAGCLLRSLRQKPKCHRVKRRFGCLKFAA